MTPDEVQELEPILRRVIAARIDNGSAVDDLVQDALEHLLAARRRIDPDVLVAYAVVTARNIASSYRRRSARHDAGLPRLVDLDSPPEPHEALLRSEEHAELAVALSRLPSHEQEILLSHEVLGVSVRDLTADGASESTTRVRLARSRAKLRVEYLLVAHGLELSTPQCRPTLLVLAGGDRTRMASPSTARHLVDCGTCAALGPQVVERRRSVLALVPLIGVQRITTAVRSHPVTTTATATVAAAAVAAAVVMSSAPSPSPATTSSVTPTVLPAAPTTATTTVPSTAPTSPPVPTPRPPTSPGLVTAGGGSLWATGAAPLLALVGQRVVARGAVVNAVVTHNGFWVSSSSSERVFVELVGPLRPLRVHAGDRVSFRAAVVGQSSGYAAGAGLGPATGAEQLTAEGAHLEVPTVSLTIAR